MAAGGQGSSLALRPRRVHSRGPQWTQTVGMLEPQQGWFSKPGGHKTTCVEATLGAGVRGMWEGEAGPGRVPAALGSSPLRSWAPALSDAAPEGGPAQGPPAGCPHRPSLLSQQVPPWRGGRGPQRHPGRSRRHCPQCHVLVPRPAPRVPPAPRPFSRPNRQARGG